MLFLLGIIEFGHGYLAKHLLANASRMGTRMSVVDGATNAEIEGKVQQFVADSLGANINGVVVTFEVEHASGGTSSDISTATTDDMCTVNVAISFDEVALFSGGFLNGLSLQSECTMEHE
jgi:Flp pilus assembly protein TadG